MFLAGETSDFSRVNTHGVAINNSLNEIYVSTQGENGKNSGVQVLDKISGSFKQFIPYGITPTDIIADETRDLVYLTDFGPTSVHPADSGGGTVAVIDARTKSVVAEVHIAVRGKRIISPCCRTARLLHLIRPEPTKTL